MACIKFITYFTKPATNKNNADIINEFQILGRMGENV